MSGPMRAGAPPITARTAMPRLEPWRLVTHKRRSPAPRTTSTFPNRSDPGPWAGLVGCWWWVWLEGLVPPPVGAFAAGTRAGRDRGRRCGWWAGQGGVAECSAGAVGDHEVVGGSGDGDDAAVVQPVMVGADQHEVE